MKSFLFAIGVLVLLAPAFANAEEIACKATRWPYSRTQDKRSYYKIFDESEREALTEYLFYEVTHPLGPYTAYYLVTFLANTGEDEGLRKFFESVKWGAELESEKSEPRKLNLEEVCFYYRKIVAESRKPHDESSNRGASTPRARRPATQPKPKWPPDSQ